MTIELIVTTGLPHQPPEVRPSANSRLAMGSSANRSAFRPLIMG
ncbi:MAG: hypothetical protein V3U11_13590 [Planctomycetota bacterium]